MTLFFKYSNPEINGKELLLKVEIEPNNSYSIKSGKINFFDFDPLKPNIVFALDDFSKTLREQGFDENDVRMELEDLIESRKKDEIV